MTLIFVGFANNHGPDMFQMLNPHTHQTTNNVDIIWLNCVYYVTPYLATTKRLPEIVIPQSEQGKYNDGSDDESQYVSTLPTSCSMILLRKSAMTIAIWIVTVTKEIPGSNT